MNMNIARRGCFVVAFSFVVLAVVGCNERSRAKMPVYTQNPAPKDQYDLTITVNNPPGSFQVVEGWVQYDITNMDCLPPAEYFSGVQTTPISTSVPVTLNKIGDNTYKGRVALDSLVDGDYFGHGICRFKPIGPGFRFKASGADGETRFVATLNAEDMTEHLERTFYYWRGNYPREKKIANYADHGASSPDEYVERLRGDLFSVKVTTARMVQQ